jgi:hypothetical protein
MLVEQLFIKNKKLHIRVRSNDVVLATREIGNAKRWYVDSGVGLPIRLVSGQHN